MARVLHCSDLTLDLAPAFSVRASSTPLIMRCAGSLYPEPGEILINQDSDATALGIASHVAVRPLAEDGSVDWHQISELAREHDVDRDELSINCAMATSLWAHVSESFPFCQTEVPLEYRSGGLLLTGTADGVSIGGTVGRVWDWKFGYRDHDYSAQMKSYASLLLLANPELTEATATIGWVKDRQVENRTLDRRDAEAWFERVKRQALDWDGVYHTGPQCEWCLRTTTCPAARAMVRRSVDAFRAETAAEQLTLMEPDAIVDLVETAKMVGRMAEAARRAVRAHVLRCGPVVGTGQQLVVEESHPRSVDVLRGIEVAQELHGFDRDELGECLRISLDAMHDIVAGKAPRGQKKSAKERLDADLEKAGAIETTTRHRLVVKRV